MWAARAPHLGSAPLRASDRARQALHASVHTAVRSIHTASAGPRVSPSTPHHPLLIHAPPPPPLHALAPLLLLPPRVGVVAPPSERQSWPSLPSSLRTAAASATSPPCVEPPIPPSVRQQPAPAPPLLPPRAGAAPPSAQQQLARCSSAHRHCGPSARRCCPFLSPRGSSRRRCSSMRWRRPSSLSSLVSAAAGPLLVPPQWQKAADLDGEGVAEEVREASDGCEHRALDELPRSLESLAQVLFLFIIIVTHAPSLGSTDGGQTRRVSSSSRGGGGSEGGFRDRIDGQLAAEMWVRWRRRKEERAWMKAKKHSRHGYPKLRPDRVACEPWFPSCYHRGGGDGVDTSQRRG
uniref:CCT domain-containing protein n=1 Tax=Oryza meridionalis TaxID=40149 RepID=A0A0E0CJV7_9ORYZ